MFKIERYSLNQFISLALILICLSALAYCIFKVTYTLLTKPIPTNNTPKWVDNGGEHTSYSSKQKDVFSIKFEDFIPTEDQTNLVEGNTYFIIKTVFPHIPKTQCLYGMFRLIKKMPSQLKFQDLNHFAGKKIEQYGHIQAQKIQYSVLKNEQLPSKMLNCKNWINIENIYQLKDAEQPDLKPISVISFSKSKCKIINSSNIIAVHSDHPNILYYEFDYIQNKLKMCTKKPGIALTHVLSFNSGRFQDQYIKVEK